MTFSLLITDGGPHPTDKWAKVTAEQIVEIAEHIAGRGVLGQTVKLEAAIIDIIEEHHATVQNGERAAIAEHGHDRLTHEVDPEHHLTMDEAIAAIQGAAAATPWAEALRHEEAVRLMKELLSNHFAASIDIERSWHADRNQDTEQAKAFRAARHPGE